MKIFESRRENLLPFHRFIRRIGMALLVAGMILVIALTIGVLGYHYLASLSWVDAFLNASMILTGMGPVAQLNTTPAKLFASFYAIFSGVVFITSMAVVLAPVFHRALHKFHLEEER